MEYLQYHDALKHLRKGLSFKPCYKWNTFNTMKSLGVVGGIAQVLNLVISGIPSIRDHGRGIPVDMHRFKPCYKWNTFNT